ncbi:hypothetical protein FJZ31_32540 [Candidatus Poribacteria bacterium]|nr:hypothetical protein [Candidatus Poribacteria bacterium]
MPLKQSFTRESIVSARAVILGLILIPLNACWIWGLEVVRYTHPTLVVPFSNVMFIVFIITAISLLLRKLSRRLAFGQGELLVLYVMLSTASALASIDMLQILISDMGHAFWFATPENEWKELFWKYLPDWLVVKDPKVLTAYYKGESSFYTPEDLKAWATPLFCWGAFTLALIFVMLCINALLRRQWVEQERLTYPIIQLPLELTELNPPLSSPRMRGERGGGFFRHQLMWMGFALAAGISVINGLSYFYPTIPQIPVKRRSIDYLFTDKPWNMMGSTTISFYPFVIGIGFLIPLDLLFSAWFFYWMYKFQLLFSGMMGWRQYARVPFYSEQAFGAIIGMSIFVFWAGREHFRRIFRGLWTGVTEQNQNREPLSYRTAVFGLIGGIVFLTLFSNRAGMSLWAVPIFFTVYFIVAVFIVRLRAELGFLVHNLHYVKPVNIMMNFCGTRHLGANNLSVFALYNFFNRTYRSHPMPHQLEAFKLAERANLNSRRLFIVILIAAGASIITTFWMLLHFYYKIGAESGYFGPWALGLGQGTFSDLQNWLYYPTATDYLAIVFMCFGFAVSSVLMFLRMRFFWWPLHPLGYVLASDWGMYNLWSCLFVSWVAKWIVLRHGALKSYRRAVPFFLGLALGDYTIGGLWSIAGIALDTTIYQFFP